MATITNFSSKFRGGVRPNLFNCSITPPSGVILSNDFSFHCKGTSMPASTVPTIDVNYLGRQLKVPGDRTYADWTVTVFNDVDMSIRHAFEGWMHLIQNHGANIQSLGARTSPTDSGPYGQATVTQISRQGTPISSYFLEVIPTEVAAIDVAWESNDAVEEYAVTFSVNYWVTKNTSGNATVGGEDSLSWHINGNKNGITGGGLDAKIGKLRAIIGV